MGTRVLLAFPGGPEKPKLLPDLFPLLEEAGSFLVYVPEGPSAHLEARTGPCAGTVGEEEILIPPSLSPSPGRTALAIASLKGISLGSRCSPHSPLKEGTSSGAHNPGVLTLPLSWFTSPCEPMVCIIGKLGTHHALKTLRLPLAFSRL